MTSSTNQQQLFPAVPPSMSAGDHEMRDYYAPPNASRPTMNQTPNFKPYLGLRARLSQIWINRWTILLLLILVRLLFAIASTDSSLASARREALSACTQVEKLGSSMASMPHYMASGVNQLTASGIERAVSALMKTTLLSVTAVEEIVLFVVHMLTSTYLCLITFAVSGSLGATIEVADEIGKSLNKTINDVTEDIGDAVQTVTDGINSILNKTNVYLGSDFVKPDINLDSQISKLKSLEISPKFQQSLQKLNSSIPTFDTVQNFTDNIIRTPFEAVKKLMQDKSAYEFDGNVLPVPQKEALSFCSEGNGISDFFNDLITMVYKARKIALGVLIVLAIVVCVPMAWMEVRRYRKMELRTALLAQGHDGLDVVYLASRPTSSTVGLWMGRRFGSSRRQAIIRWAWAYATSAPMMFLLSLGIAGLFSCFCQYLLLKAIEDKAPELTNQVADFAGDVVKSLNNASMAWSQGVNGAMSNLSNEINEEMFDWVNTTTTAVNDTLNAFVSEMSGTLNDTFGGTPLYEPIKEVLNCLIGLKIAGFQKGLTWASENAQVNFPSIANDTLSLGALAEVGDSGSSAQLLADPSGKAADEITEAVNRVIQKFLSGIQTEALISATLLLIWLLIALGGFIYASTQLFRRDFESSTAYVYELPVQKTPKSHDYHTDAPPQYGANDYHPNLAAHNAAPYALQPRPFPDFGPDSPREKIGQVDAHAVMDSARPGHVRASSYGQMGSPGQMSSPSPDEKYNPNNPFADNRPRVVG